MPKKKSGKAKGSKAKGKRKRPSTKKRARSKGRPPRKGGKRAHAGKKGGLHHNPKPLVVSVLMVVVTLAGFFLISEYPDDKTTIAFGIVGMLALGILAINASTPKAPRRRKGHPQGKGRRRPAAPRPGPKSAAHTITPSVPAGAPAPLPLQVPMATIAPIVPRAVPATPPGLPGTPVATTPAGRPQLQPRSAIMPRARIVYPVNVGGGDFANTHILVNKDTILQLRSPLLPKFKSDGFPAGTRAADNFPTKPYEAPETPVVAPGSAPAAPAWPPVAPAAAPAGMPGMATVTPIAVTPEIVPATPVAVAPLAGTAAEAVTPAEEKSDERMIDFGDDDSEDEMDWD